MNEEVFKEKCGSISIKQLTRTAKERRPGSMGVAEALILEYNGKKKNSAYRLNIRLLYERDVSLWVESDDEPYDDSDEFENLFDGSNNE